MFCGCSSFCGLLVLVVCYLVCGLVDLLAALMLPFMLYNICLLFDRRVCVAIVLCVTCLLLLRCGIWYLCLVDC